MTHGDDLAVITGLSTQQNTRRWWVIGGLGVALMTAVAIWFGVASGAGKVEWGNAGFDVVSDEQVDVRFDIYRDPSRAVECVIEAQDKSHFVVGRTTTVVEPSDASPSRQIASVQTAGPAVTGYVERCEYIATPG